MLRLFSLWAHNRYHAAHFLSQMANFAILSSLMSPWLECWTATDATWFKPCTTVLWHSVTVWHCVAVWQCHCVTQRKRDLEAEIERTLCCSGFQSRTVIGPVALSTQRFAINSCVTEKRGLQNGGKNVRESDGDWDQKKLYPWHTVNVAIFKNWEKTTKKETKLLDEIVNCRSHLKASLGWEETEEKYFSRSIGIGPRWT